MDLDTAIDTDYPTKLVQRHTVGVQALIPKRKGGGAYVKLSSIKI